MRKNLMLLCLILVAGICLAQTPAHPNWVTFTRTSPTTGTIRWSSEPSANVSYYYFGLHPTTTMYFAPAYCDPNWNVPGGWAGDQTLESPGVYKKEVGALDPTKEFYAYVAAVETGGWTWSAYSSWEPPISMYDHPENGIPASIGGGGTFQFTLGNANNNPGGSAPEGFWVNPLWNANGNLPPLMLMNSGPWTIRIIGANGLYINWTHGPDFGTVQNDGDVEIVVPASKGKGPFWAGLGGEGTLPVELSSFTATLTASSYVTLAWTSQSETNLLGYRLYRSENQNLADATMITPIMIQATNTSTECNYSHNDYEVSTNTTYWYWLESIEHSGGEMHGPTSVSVTGADPDTPALPENTGIGNIYPNPMRVGGTAYLDVSVKAGDKVDIIIYNTRGQVIRTMNLTEGFHKVDWDGTDSRGNLCASGTYLYRISSPLIAQTRKLIFMK